MKTTFFWMLIVSCQLTFAQTNFDRYRTLMSAGPIPEDFSKETYEKLKDEAKKDREGLNKKQEGEFSTMIHYGLDNVLHSGLCVYGDPLSNYITEVARNLLKDDPELFNKLRFYTIKSNVANAFSTDQGIVVFTTGLVSQFSNEAQLAYVVAHEISHFTENHVVQSFSYNDKARNKSDYIENMSTYSKDKEFQADKIAVALCHKAGYSDNEIYNSFDVLMYSHLPFDEIEFPANYFDSDVFFIPKDLFPSEKYPIKAEEDYDDDLSTHPNIKKRKDTVNVALSDFDNWGDKSFLFDKSKFDEISTIARFENVRTDILDAEFVNALYSIFLLEKDFPNSFYLQKMKAHAWLGLYHLKTNNNLSEAVKKTSELEGESAALHYLIKKMNSEGIGTLALREIHDIKKMYPEDFEINFLYDRLISKLVNNSKFKIEKYSKKSFQEASQGFLATKEAKKNDTIPRTEEPVAEKKTKYERIKKNKDANEPENFDSTKYYLYGLSDIIEDENFKTIFAKYTSQKDAAEQEENRLNALSKAARKKELAKKEKESQLNITNLIVVEPTVISYDKNGVNYVKSDELELNLEEAIAYSAEDLGIDLIHIDKGTLASGGTEAFNERNTLFTLLNQLYSAEQNEEGVLPIDFDLLKEFKNHYNTENVMFTLVEHYYKPRLSPGGVVGMIFLPPLLPLYIIRGFALANNTEMTNILLNTDNGTVEFSDTNFSRTPVKKWYLRSELYDFFTGVKKNKK